MIQTEAVKEPEEAYEYHVIDNPVAFLYRVHACGIAIIGLVCMMLGLLGVDMLWCLLLFGALEGMMVFPGWVTLKADPPTLGAIKFFGKIKVRMRALGPGGDFLLFGYPIVTNIEPVPAVTMDFDFKVKVAAKDNSEYSEKVSLAFDVDPDHVGVFIQRGKKEGIQILLDEPVAQAARERGSFFKTATDARHADANQGVGFYYKRLQVSRIPSTVPTSILFKYRDKMTPDENEAKVWGEKWEKVEERINEEGREEIMAALTRRESEVRTLIASKASLPFREWGMNLLKISVGAVELLGEYAKVAELGAKEKKEAEGEALQNEAITKRLAVLKKQCPGISDQALMELDQVERGKRKGITISNGGTGGSGAATPVLLLGQQ